MPKRPCTPIITHTEILSRAIRTVEQEIEVWRNQCKVIPNAEEYFAAATIDLEAKLDTLKAMYYYETGSEYR